MVGTAFVKIFIDPLNDAHIHYLSVIAICLSFQTPCFVVKTMEFHFLQYNTCMNACLHQLFFDIMCADQSGLCLYGYLWHTGYHSIVEPLDEDTCTMM